MAKVRTIKTHLFLFSLSFFLASGETKKNPACRQAGKKGQGIRQLADCRANALQVSLPRFRQSLEESSELTMHVNLNAEL